MGELTRDDARATARLVLERAIIETHATTGLRSGDIRPLLDALVKALEDSDPHSKWAFEALLKKEKVPRMNLEDVSDHEFLKDLILAAPTLNIQCDYASLTITEHDGFGMTVSDIVEIPFKDLTSVIGALTSIQKRLSMADFDVHGGLVRDEKGNAVFKKRPPPPVIK